MKVKLKLAAVTALAAAAAVFGACRADDIAGSSQASSSTGASQAATKNAAPKPAPSVVAQATPEEARRITVEELKKLLDSGKAVVYDTRAKGAYDAEHIKGSLSMPHDEVAARSEELPKDKMIVFYCT